MSDQQPPSCGWWERRLEEPDLGEEACVLERPVTVSFVRGQLASLHPLPSPLRSPNSLSRLPSSCLALHVLKTNLGIGGKVLMLRGKGCLNPAVLTFRDSGGTLPTSHSRCRKHQVILRGRPQSKRKLTPYSLGGPGSMCDPVIEEASLSSRSSGPFVGSACPSTEPMPTAGRVPATTM